LSFSFEILNRMPVPIDGRTNSLGHRVAEIAGLLAAKDARFDEWAGRVNVPVGSAEEADQRSALTEELDAVVAHLYDLSEHELEHVFATFQRGWDYAAQLERVLSHFNRWKDRL
jgi:hypothetical protein